MVVEPHLPHPRESDQRGPRRPPRSGPTSTAHPSAERSEPMQRPTTPKRSPKKTPTLACDGACDDIHNGAHPVTPAMGDDQSRSAQPASSSGDLLGSPTAAPKAGPLGPIHPASATSPSVLNPRPAWLDHIPVRAVLLARRPAQSRPAILIAPARRRHLPTCHPAAEGAVGCVACVVCTSFRPAVALAVGLRLRPLVGPLRRQSRRGGAAGQ